MAGVAVLVLGVASAAVVAETTATASRPATRSPGAQTRPGGSGSQPATSPTTPAAVTKTLSAAGVTSTAIISENQRRGTADWQIPGTPAGAGSIAGFASTTYAAAGQTVELHVTTTAPTFQAAAYRMGWYQGLGGRLVWASPEVTGRTQPPCQVTPGVNMVSCDNWSVSLRIPITAAFIQGDYLIKLIGSGHQESYIPLTIWDPHSTAAYLVVNRSLTEEGWNTYGGFSYYQGVGGCTLGQTGSYPPCNRARIVSFDRPYAAGNGASDFLANEYPLIRFMEQRGLDAAYVTDITLDAHPATILQHRGFCSRLATTRRGPTTNARAPRPPSSTASTWCSSGPPPSCATRVSSPPRWAPTARRSTTGIPRKTPSTAPATLYRSRETPGVRRLPTGQRPG